MSSVGASSWPQGRGRHCIALSRANPARTLDVMFLRSANLDAGIERRGRMQYERTAPFVDVPSGGPKKFESLRGAF